MRLLWATDLHLDPAADDFTDSWSSFLQAVSQVEADCLLVSGDIAQANSFELALKRLADETGLPVAFVLGNHDFYGSSIAAVRRQAVSLAREHSSLRYLTDDYPLPITPRAVLIGEDGWADATIGDYDQSYVRLNDFHQIAEFQQQTSDHWKSTLRRLGQESAQRLADKLAKIPAETRQVVVVTHVPPFREACWYEGRTADDDWAPFFVCGAVGECLRHAAKQSPQIQFTVLCGHTHHRGVAAISDNLIVYTGAAAPGVPALEALIYCDDETTHVDLIGQGVASGDRS